MIDPRLTKLRWIRIAALAFAYVFPYVWASFREKRRRTEPRGRPQPPLAQLLPRRGGRRSILENAESPEHIGQRIAALHQAAGIPIATRAP